MSLLVLGKIALVVFLVLGCSALVISYLRRRPKGGPQPLSDPNASGYLDLYGGRVAPTPLPEWVTWDETSGQDGTGEDPDAGASRRGL